MSWVRYSEGQSEIICLIELLLLGFLHFGMKRFEGEPNDTNSNNKAIKEENVSVDDEVDKLKLKPITALKSLTSSNKPHLSNFSVLSLLARKSQEKEGEK